jgi:hypothetical protein
MRAFYFLLELQILYAGMTEHYVKLFNKVFSTRTLLQGFYNFKGFYRVKWQALLQGAAMVELEQLGENQMRPDTPVKSVELKE